MNIARGRGLVIIEMSENDHAKILAGLGYAAGATKAGPSSSIHDEFVRLISQLSGDDEGPVAVPDPATEFPPVRDDEGEPEAS